MTQDLKTKTLGQLKARQFALLQLADTPEKRQQLNAIVSEMARRELTAWAVEGHDCQIGKPLPKGAAHPPPK